MQSFVIHGKFGARTVFTNFNSSIRSSIAGHHAFKVENAVQVLVYLPFEQLNEFMMISLNL